MSQLNLVFLLSCALVTAISQAQAPAPASCSLDPNNPSGCDPTSAPATISSPTGSPPNPYPSGIPTQPDQCDGGNPSNDCFSAMGGAGGYLWFDKESSCSDDQKSMLRTAVWDATTLAFYSSNFPNVGEGTRGKVSGMFYMGPDFASQQDRISGNLKRVWQFKKTGNEAAYITISCKDTKNVCTSKVNGMVPGGYAWTYSGWTAYYHCITFCPPFFTMNSLEQTFEGVQKELAGGVNRMSTDMRYLKSTGQWFLHEMMHTRIADGGIEPHILDEYVMPVPADENPTIGDTKAYGAEYVHSLAVRKLKNGGGVTRASTNADSYAMLANAIWWWDTTNYFPGVPGKINPSSAQEDISDGADLVSLYVEFDNNTIPSTVDFTSLYSPQVDTFGNITSEPYDPNDEDTSTPPPSPSSTSPTAASPPPSPPPPAPTDLCGDWYQVFDDYFEIRGTNFDATKFGTDGFGLQQQIKGCGALSDWNFSYTPNDPRFAWLAKGKLPIGTKACTGRAVVSAGGANADGCTGSG